MRGFIAVTDLGWYERLFALGAKLGPMDANFWRPIAVQGRSRNGNAVSFRLRAPANAHCSWQDFECWPSTFSLAVDFESGAAKDQAWRSRECATLGKCTTHWSHAERSSNTRSASRGEISLQPSDFY